MRCGNVWNITVDTILFLLTLLLSQNYSLKKGPSKCELLIIPLDFLPDISCRLPLKCHLTRHNQDHVPKVGKFHRAIPTVEHRQ